MATSRNLKQFPNNTGQKYDNKVARNESRAHETFYEPKFDDVPSKGSEGGDRKVGSVGGGDEEEGIIISDLPVEESKRVGEIGGRISIPLCS